MNIDLFTEADDIRNMISKSVSKYTKANASKTTAKKYPPVSRIDLTYFLGDGGPAAPFIVLHLDTRPGANPDGSHTHAEFATLKRPAWRPMINGLFDRKPATITLLSGDTKKLTTRNVTKAIGEFLVAVLKGARSDGLWSKLPKLPECEFGVEEIGGSFGWPAYNKRGRINAA